MFTPNDYIERRRKLRERLGTGLVLIPGNDESPMNYPANIYPFRQDSTFLYFFGVAKPGMSGVMDLDEGTDWLFGEEPTLEDVIWMGPQPGLAELAASGGIARTGSPRQLREKITEAASKRREIHFPPPYRGEHFLRLEELLGQSRKEWQGRVCGKLIRAVVELRSIKSEGEIKEIENALDVTHEAFIAVGQSARPDAAENEIFGTIQDIFGSHGRQPAYPVILSVHGEILHNQGHDNTLKRGDLLLVDAGATSPGGYASDITRTFPVGGSFLPEQREVYRIVLAAQQKAIDAIAPGKSYRDIHALAAKTIAAGLKEMGLLKGDVDALVAEGAHALFFPHGLGHQMGLDVHDMENLGEDYVGYDGEHVRSSQFGLAYLRLARRLQTGFVLTVEPGIYFIPALIDRWKAEGKYASFINYAKVEEFKAFGGIRIEDDILVTQAGCRVLGKPIPKSLEEMGR